MISLRKYIALLITSFAVTASAQVWENHSEMVWQTFETKHFMIHFHQSTERSAREVATVAEKIYGPITDLYDSRPASKTHVIIKDANDQSNGIAYFFDNKIEIWARPLDYDLRGSHRWLQDVMTHEFAHIVQMSTAMKFTSRVPGIYFQWLKYEDEKREDVLYGYPNGISSYPYPGTNIPPWFAEGVAQYMYEGATYGFWDSNRDMLLRDRVMNDNLLRFAAMNSFGKSGIGNESAYNQGFAFVSYLAGRFGSQALQAISREMSKPRAISMSKAMGRATGVNGIDLYHDWIADINRTYAERMESVTGSEVNGDIILEGGVANLHPVWHPSDQRFAYLSNKEADYFSQTALYVHDLTDGSDEKISDQVGSPAGWSVDGGTLYYGAKGRPDEQGSVWYDLYAYNFSDEEEERLTHGERVTSPVAIDSNTVAYLTVYDGTSNIRLYDLEADSATSLTTFDDGTYIHSLAYDEGNRALVYDATINQGRELFSLNLETAESVHISLPANMGGDSRMPDVGPDRLFYATDASGVFNIYRAGVGYLTNVIGGAFMPSVNAEGEMLYSLYVDGAYKIALMSMPNVVDAAVVGVTPDQWRSRPTAPQEGPNMALFANPYREEMTDLFVLPRIMVDYGTIKPGFFAYASEVLGRMNLIGGASINSLGDTDYFLLTEFSKLKPTLYAEIFTQQRKVNQDISYYDYQGDNDLRFNLMEAVIGARQSVRGHRLWLDLIHDRARVHVSQVLAGNEAGSIGYDYFVGTTLSARWLFSTRRPEFGGNMFPMRGNSIALNLRAENNGLADSLSISDFATIVPLFDPSNTVRIKLDVEQYLPIIPSRHIGLAYEGQFGWLSNKDVDDYFYFFGGGMPGLKGYTYYDSTAQGTNLMINSLTLRVPLFIEQHFTFGQLTLQNASIGAVVQFGDAFNGSWLEERLKQSAGLEFRLSGYNFYVLPFALTYEIHRPLNDDGKWRHIFSWLFDF